MTEADFLRAVTDLAKLRGYMVYHPWISIRSQPGYPDLTLVHPHTGRLLFAELKTGTNKVTAAQRSWLDALGILHQAFVWRPADLASGEIDWHLTHQRLAQQVIA